MSDGFYLGGVVDPATGERGEDPLHYDGGDLTTHGVIVGMTGSGKTGLGIIYLEEALLAGVPTLILDPKGDMTNLLLTFPDLLPEDFRPWIDEAQARKEGKSVDELAADTAELWRNGLAGWDQGPDRIRKLRDAADFVVYTPGSSAGVPVNIVGSLRAPGTPFDDEAEALRDEIEGFVSGLLGLVGIDADPISSREHILLANLVEHAWRQGQDLDLAALLGQIQQPPLRKLGVFDIDTFFPEKDRLALAMKLNGLIASPAFAAWLQGPPLDVGRLLFDDQGRPQASVMYLAHLSEEERQFIVTLLLSKVVTWMRQQSGTGDLRALVYMDEVYGFVPPTANPPAKKPILTLLKQARAFGVGLMLSTQNPVDLDYKAMSNAGTWNVGRLQTERDKARILEALQSARGDSDVAELDRTVSGLGKRQFLLHNTREKQPALFTTRWAMSYLRGPMTKQQVEQLSEAARARLLPEPEAEPATAGEPAAAGAPVAARQAGRSPTAPELGADESPVAPTVADGVPVGYLDPAAPWAEAVGAAPGGHRLQAALAARVHLFYDETRADLKHEEEYEAVFTPLGERFDPETGVAVDYDDRDFRDDPPKGAVYALPEADLSRKGYFTEAERAIRDWLYRNRSIEIYRCPGLKLYSRAGESREDFAARCDRVAGEMADAEIAKERDRFETKLRRLRDQAAAAERRLDELQVDVSGRRRNEVLEGVGDLLGGLLGGRRSSRSVTRASRRRSQTRSTEARLRAAEDKLEDKLAAIQEAEQALYDEVALTTDGWDGKAEVIEAVEVGLEKQDIDVEGVTLAWIPVGS